MAITITQPSAAWLPAAEALYLASFPPEERRPWDEIVNPQSPSGPRLAIILDGGEFAGMVTTWRFDGFVYVEHLAIDHALRGRGIGAALLAELSASAGLPLLLEVEPPADDNPMAARRIGFYSRNGFHLLDHDYIQPPYSPELPPVPLKLMSTDPALDALAATAILHREVYRAGHTPEER